jgi:NAD-dependent SIR2 family protein deacetylase
MREIVSAMAQRTCVVFAGAGLSKNAGLPGWSELASFLVTSLLADGKIKEHFESPIKAMLEQNKLSECMELMLLASSRRDILSRMRGTLKPKQDSEVHAILKKLQLRGYITTNYDRLLEDVCESTCYWPAAGLIDTNLH